MARAPRRSFTAPFVITLAAIPAACTVQSAPPPQEPVVRQPPPSQPPPTDPQTQPQTQPQQPDTVVVANPPRPTPPPSGGTTTPAARDTVWYISKTATGCAASMRVECPTPEPGKPAITCNPPPPIDYACPAGWDGKSQLLVTQYAGSTECVIEGPAPNCRPNEKCRMPTPRKVACPKR